MGFIPENMTARQKVMAGVAVVVLLLAGLLIYNSIREEGQPAPSGVVEDVAPPPENPPSSGPRRMAPGT